MDTVTASKVVQQEMEALSLNDFPCGIGSWNSSRHSSKETKGFKLLKDHAKKEEINGKNVNEEEPQALKEYLTCEQSPWTTENVTPESQHLKELAITSPSLINERFLCSYLKSLRLVNKKICEVDKEMLKFQNLEELILSVNKITSLNSENLPRKLKILELCSNEISSLQQLSSNPPPMLQYLGLSYNKLSLSSDYRYLSDIFWPNIISLDLSFNDFVNLRDIVTSLSFLPNLKNFIFLGNPLAFYPYYRGFTIDILQNLVSLDDILISPDERHHFKGIASRQDFIAPEAKVTIEIEKVTGIPNPIDPLDEPPEFPVVKNSYFVTYEFLGSPESAAEVNELNEPHKEGNKDVQNEKPSSAKSSEKDPSSSQTIPEMFLDSMGISNASSENKEYCHVFTHKLPLKPWGDPIVYNYIKIHLVKDPYALKQLLQNGLTVTVIEEKILSWPIETEDDKIPEASMKEKDQGPAKGGKSKAKDVKDKDKTKEKSKSPVSLQSDPPIEKILGSCHVDLYSIVTGSHDYQTVCDLGVPKIEEKPKSPTPELKETKKGKGDKQKGKGDKSGKDSRTSAKMKTPNNKKAKGKRNTDLRISGETTPKHLFVGFKLHLQKWLTLTDAENEIYKKNTVFNWFDDA
ncbi:leucine-rich repeat-containing protein 43-like [Stegostoma tigrinum]|uniref:leucine-rich repeat-containing protein 43-like n=1 Tax=Stegostoma tigrinum TaxID=3053191 RepID=UPI002870801D|nr:leucine-rich repeat-containing protein 43-like [Stegostoma tigrinum]